MRLMILLPLLAVLLILPPIMSVNAKKVEDNTPSGLGFIPKSTHCEGLEGTAKGGINYDDGYDQGYVDAHRHFVGKSGHANAPDDILDNARGEYKAGYQKGYSEGLEDAKQGIQDPKC